MDAMAYIRAAGRRARYVRRGIVGRDGTAVWHQAIGAAAGLPLLRRRAKSRAGCDFEWPSTSGRASLPLRSGPGIAWGVNFSADGEVLAVAYDDGGRVVVTRGGSRGSVTGNDAVLSSVPVRRGETLRLLDHRELPGDVGIARLERNLCSIMTAPPRRNFGRAQDCGSGGLHCARPAELAISGQSGCETRNPRNAVTLLSLLSYAAPYRAELALASLLMVLETAAALVIPWLGGRFAGELLSADVAASRLILPSLLAAFAIQAALKFANGFLLTRVSERILADLRIRVYDHLQALPLQFFHERAKGDVLALITREVPQLSGFITGSLIRVVPMGLAMAGAVTQMARTDWLLAALVAVQIPAFFLALKVIGRRLRSLSMRIQEEEATSIAIAEENLGMLPIIKNLCREPTELHRYSAQICEVMRLSVTQSRIYAALEPAVQFIAAAAVILLLGIAERRIAGGQMTPGALVGFLLYAVMLTRPIGAAADLYGQTRMARGTLERLHRVLGERPEPDRAGGRSADDSRRRNRVPRCPLRLFRTIAGAERRKFTRGPRRNARPDRSQWRGQE